MGQLAEATDLLRLLGDPSRVRLISLLGKEELTVAELTRVTRLSQPRVSTHLGKLKDAGLVVDRRAGKSSFYKASGSAPADVRELCRIVLDRASDPLLDQDAERLKEVVRARTGNGTWADTVAGQMERHYSPGRTWEAALRGLLGLMRLGDVLDVASGDCAIAELLSPRARSVTCLDSSRTVLRAGQRRLRRHPRVAFRRADMHALPFADASFDQVMLLACLCYAERPDVAAREAARVLSPGGSLVAVTLRSHRHRERVARYDHRQLGFGVRRLRRMFEDAGLLVEFCGVTSRERRAPHFEVVTLHARR